MNWMVCNRAITPSRSTVINRAIKPTRCFTTKSNTDADMPWRKRQILKLEEKFNYQAWPEYPIQQIQTDDDLQGAWKQMESRVTRRMAPLTKEQLLSRGKSLGRKNIKKTEEEEWLKAGLYG